MCVCVCVRVVVINSTMASSKSERDKWVIASWWRAFWLPLATHLTVPVVFIVATLISFSHGHAIKSNLGSIHVAANSHYVKRSITLVSYDGIQSLLSLTS